MKYLKTKFACTILCTAGFLYWQNNGLMLTKKCHYKNVPKGFNDYKILQVSDLQNKAFGNNQARLLSKIRNATPDIIVVTGDLIDRNRTNLDTAMAFVDGAVDIAPVYYVSGNHEHQSGYFEELTERLTQAGVTVLENGKSIIKRNGDTLEIIGLADKRVNPYFDQALSTLLKGGEDGRFRLLLCHRPELFKTYVEKGVHLAFTGHAHGGQIRLPFIGGVFAPNQGFFPTYTTGVYEKANTAMVVSRGLGNSTFPFRFFNRPELVLITLKSENKVEEII
ncbi:metallophosphoesterase [Anaerotignum sp. MB30-C6]|uniref:metallophosphoesterase n=1 Tax=Anaerotignum sp. MB30-C6 TaxID=3070814 RepID=UPI0027DD1311|nr:metallophosphoesterase [Anaerotignum sp. MB30-C6]WMI82167.1 metallophosphoesterase [Anaerotignum sp. MB30-C6]